MSLYVEGSAYLNIMLFNSGISFDLSSNNFIKLPPLSLLPNIAISEQKVSFETFT